MHKREDLACGCSSGYVQDGIKVPRPALHQPLDGCLRVGWQWCTSTRSRTFRCRSGWTCPRPFGPFTATMITAVAVAPAPAASGRTRTSVEVGVVIGIHRLLRAAIHNTSTTASAACTTAAPAKQESPQRHNAVQHEQRKDTYRVDYEPSKHCPPVLLLLSESRRIPCPPFSACLQRLSVSLLLLQALSVHFADACRRRCRLHVVVLCGHINFYTHMSWRTSMRNVCCSRF